MSTRNDKKCGILVGGDEIRCYSGGAISTYTVYDGIEAIHSPWLAVSVIGHLAALIVGLFFVGANAFRAPPPEAVVVEVVTPDEMPRFEGTPSNLHSSGSETPSPANGKGPVTQAPPPQPRPQQQQQSRERPTPQREANEAPRTSSACVASGAGGRGV